MNKRHVTCMFLMVVGITFISFIGQSCSKSKESTKVVRVVFDKHAGKWKIENGQSIPVFGNDPSEDIKKYLRRAGFRLVSMESKDYDLTLKVRHEEKSRSLGRQYGYLTTLDTVYQSFVLEEKDGTILIKEAQSPFSTAKIDSFAKNLVELVQLRIQKPDETSCWLEFLSRRADEVTLETIEKAADPTYNKRQDQVVLLKPLLISYKSSVKKRIAVLRFLQALNYTPVSNTEAAAVFIVQSYPFRRWSAQSGEASVDAWAARQGVISVIKYATVAIDLLVEDLKGQPRVHVSDFWFEEGGVASRAKAILSRLSEERWAKFGYGTRFGGWTTIEYINYKEESAFCRVKFYKQFGSDSYEVEVVNPERASKVYAGLWNQEWNDYAIKKLVDVLEKGRNVSIDEDYLKKTGINNRNYFQDVIEILGKIADSRAIQLLKSYLDHPKFAEDAEKAIENIEKREK